MLISTGSDISPGSARLYIHKGMVLKGDPSRSRLNDSLRCQSVQRAIQGSRGDSTAAQVMQAAGLVSAEWTRATSHWRVGHRPFQLGWSLKPPTVLVEHKRTHLVGGVTRQIDYYLRAFAGDVSFNRRPACCLSEFRCASRNSGEDQSQQAQPSNTEGQATPG